MVDKWSKIIAWTDNQHESVYHQEACKIDNLIEFEADLEKDDIEYNYGETIEEAEKELWKLVKEADEVREHFKN